MALDKNQEIGVAALAAVTVGGVVYYLSKKSVKAPQTAKVVVNNDKPILVKPIKVNFSDSTLNKMIDEEKLAPGSKSKTAKAGGSMKAIVAVNESRDNTPALTSLGSADEPAGLFSFALALKRAGRFDDALAAYSKLVAVRPDARTYVNLGNAYVGMNRLDDALKSYLSAVDYRPLASAYYNASQISREIFDF